MVASVSDIERINLLRETIADGKQRIAKLASLLREREKEEQKYDKCTLFELNKLQMAISSEVSRIEEEIITIPFRSLPATPNEVTLCAQGGSASGVAPPSEEPAMEKDDQNRKTLGEDAKTRLIKSLELFDEQFKVNLRKSNDLKIIHRDCSLEFLKQMLTNSNILSRSENILSAWNDFELDISKI